MNDHMIWDAPPSPPVPWRTERGVINPYNPRPGPSRPDSKIYYFAVQGPDVFPVDMLRYDQSWAVTGVGINDMAIRQPSRTVICATRNPTDLIPTTQRWEAFGWRVVVRRMEKPEGL